MNQTELIKAITEEISIKLGERVHIETKKCKQYYSIKANGKLLVLLYPQKEKGYVTVSKLTISEMGNQTCKKIKIVKDERDISMVLEEIQKLYS